MPYRIVNLNWDKRKPAPIPRYSDVSSVCPRCGRAVRGINVGEFVAMPCACGHETYQWQTSISGRFAYASGTEV